MCSIEQMIPSDPNDDAIDSDPEENHAAAIEHIERAVRKLGYVYSCSVVLRLALDGFRRVLDDS
jgi:hypothetical protein